MSQEDIIKFIKKNNNKPVTSREISKTLNIHIQSVRVNIRRLINHSIIKTDNKYEQIKNLNGTYNIQVPTYYLSEFGLKNW